jgi:hypothetical protein
MTYRRRRRSPLRGSWAPALLSPTRLVDPDIGVVLSQPGKTVKLTHLGTTDLQILCTSNPGRVIMAFDQALRRESPEESLRSKVVWLSERKTAAIAFRSHASFIFCSSTCDRIRDVRRLLEEAGLPASRLVKARRSP